MVPSPAAKSAASAPSRTDQEDRSPAHPSSVRPSKRTRQPGPEGSTSTVAPGVSHGSPALSTAATGEAGAGSGSASGSPNNAAPTIQESPTAATKNAAGGAQPRTRRPTVPRRGARRRTSESGPGREAKSTPASRRARPKSVTCGRPRSSSITFAGFRSRWITPRAWAWAIASASRATSFAADRIGVGPAPGPVSRASRKLRPGR